MSTAVYKVLSTAGENTGIFLCCGPFFLHKTLRSIKEDLYQKLEFLLLAEDLLLRQCMDGL